MTEMKTNQGKDETQIEKKRKRTEENNETIIILREIKQYIHQTVIECYEKGMVKEKQEKLLERKTHRNKKCQQN